MQQITAQQVANLLTWPDLIQSIARAFKEGVESPPRHHHTIPRPEGDATLLLMPAWEEDGFIGVKVVNVFPHNSAAGLPAISGIYLLCSGVTGQPLACIDGSELTRRRTAAASALASQLLSRPESKSLVVLGTGKLAPMLIEAHAAVRSIENIAVWGRDPQKAQAVVEQYRDQFSIHLVTDLEASVQKADIVSCATLSTRPLVLGNWLKAGAHLDLVGAFKPGMRESDSAAIGKNRVFVDTHAGARGEAGDLLHAINDGSFQWADVQGDLAELLRERVPGRQNNTDITVFKSVGASLEDLAAAMEVWRQFTLQTG